MSGKKAAAPVNKPAADAETQQDGSAIYLDPDLAKIRDAEMAKLAEIVVTPRPDPTIDPQLEKQREADMKKPPRVF